jgi:tetrahydromethanopterin S-methyltransferase subunit G|tara:strand:- start:386 stop:592 length:207 start_codon:yes stop_codon:yes gene_type:complete
MNDNVESLILERLRRIEDKLDTEIERGMETRERLGHLEEGIASISRRVDRIDSRLDRIERRLELQEAK